MKKALVSLFVLIFGVGVASAQEQRIIFYNGSNPIHTQLVNNIDSVSFVNNISSVHNNVGEPDFQFPVVGIDSIVFATDAAQIDTGDVIFITYSGNTVSVLNPWANRGVSISTNGANVVVSAASGVQDIVYFLSGTTANGSLVMNSDRRFNLVMHAVSIENPNGAAIKVLDDVKVSVTLEEENSVLDGGDATTHKAAFDSEGQIVFSGNGTLNVTGNVKHGVFSNDYIRILSGDFKVNRAVTDGFHADYFQMLMGTLDISNAKTGIDGDRGFIEISGGTINISIPVEDGKGMVCDSTVTITGGDIVVTLTGNASKGIKGGMGVTLAGGVITINANGSTVVTSGDPSYCTGIKSDGTITASGAMVDITCGSGNSGGRCLSATGNVTIAGGSMTLKTQGSGATYTNGSTTDAYGPVCISTDADLIVTAGLVDCQSTGAGGRGIKVDGSCTIGEPSGDNSLIDIDIVTSGAPIGGSGGGGGGWPPGGGGSSTNYCKPKGLKCLGNITVNSGHLSSYCAQTSGDPTGEAIESKSKIAIHGGFVEANAYDDAINSGAGFEVTGGYVWAYARGNDGIDNNGTSVAAATNLLGGVVIAAGTEEAIDANIDRGGTFYINGATVIGFYANSQGGMGIFDNPTYQNGQKYLSPSITTSGNYCIKNSAGVPVMIYTHPGTVSGSGFMDSTEGLRPPPGGGGSSRFVFTSSQVTSGNYTLYTNPAITGGDMWHGLYIGASATTSGSGTSLSAQ